MFDFIKTAIISIILFSFSAHGIEPIEKQINKHEKWYMLSPEDLYANYRSSENFSSPIEQTSITSKDLPPLYNFFKTYFFSLINDVYSYGSYKITDHNSQEEIFEQMRINIYLQMEKVLERGNSLHDFVTKHAQELKTDDKKKKEITLNCDLLIKNIADPLKNCKSTLIKKIAEHQRSIFENDINLWRNYIIVSHYRIKEALEPAKRTLADCDLEFSCDTEKTKFFKRLSRTHNKDIEDD